MRKCQVRLRSAEVISKVASYSERGYPRRFCELIRGLRFIERRIVSKTQN